MMFFLPLIKSQESSHTCTLPGKRSEGTINELSFHTENQPKLIARLEDKMGMRYLVIVAPCLAFVEDLLRGVRVLQAHQTVAPG